MRLTTTCAGIVLALTIVTGPAFALCEDKSQQNAADEAGLKGDLESASKCAEPGDAAQSQKKLEDAAARAKNRQGDQSGRADGRDRNDRKTSQ
jgi:hypothetical protein